MAETDQQTEYSRRTIYVSDKQWKRARLAATKLANEVDGRITLTELVRRGLTREIEAIESDGEYEPPEGYDA